MSTEKHTWELDPQYTGDDKYMCLDVINDIQFDKDEEPVCIPITSGSPTMDRRIGRIIVDAVNQSDDLAEVRAEWKKANDETEA